MDFRGNMKHCKCKRPIESLGFRMCKSCLPFHNQTSCLMFGCIYNKLENKFLCAHHEFKQRVADIGFKKWADRYIN